MADSCLRLVLLIAVAAVLTACGSSSVPSAETSESTPASASEAASTSASASAQGDALHVVVIGDSIPFADHFCPGCVGFAEQYGSALETSTGRPVDVANRSRDDGANLGDIEVQVQRDSELRTELGEADVVIVSVGFNNGPPWNTGGPCGGFFSRDLQAQVDTLLAYDPACFEAAAASFVPDYDAIYGEIEGLVPPSAALVALNVYNNWIGYPDYGPVSTDQVAELMPVTTGIFDAWNSMLCETAGAHRFVCGDIYHAFNGADGSEAPGELLHGDYTHPSQAGHDAIADVLEQIEIPAGG